MAESFGSSFSLVEVTSDDGSKEIWLALAKPSQAVALVLAAVAEGWTAEFLPTVLTAEQQRTFEEVNLKPGEVYKISSD